MNTSAQQSQRRWAAFLLGFSLSGFFDGILLHQILQWHHLLLGWQAGPLQDMRVQLAADGFFHLLMYALTLVALWLLWNSRRPGSTWSGRRTLAVALIGFGVWHVLDGVLSHWVLGIHRIKMDSPNPMFWDVLWLVAFGLVPLAAGVAMHRSDRHSGGPSAGGRAVAASLVVAALTLGTIAALPPQNVGAVLVVLRPGADVNRTLDAVASMHGGILWLSRGGGMWVFKVPENADYGRLYDAGALLATASPAALGCLSWTKGSPASS